MLLTDRDQFEIVLYEPWVRRIAHTTHELMLSPLGLELARIRYPEWVSGWFLAKL